MAQIKIDFDEYSADVHIIQNNLRESLDNIVLPDGAKPTDANISAAIGRSPGYVSHMLSRRSAPSIPSLLELSRLSKVPFYQLFILEDFSNHLKNEYDFIKKKAKKDHIHALEQYIANLTEILNSLRSR